MTTWNLDTAHSELQFKVRHMMISTVTGHFNTFNSTVTTEGDDFATAQIGFVADVSSLTTNNDQRDGHLKSADFFDAENHPQVTFNNGKLEPKGDGEYVLHGDLTMRGVTKPVSLNVEYGGTIKDPFGLTRAGFTIEGKINRQDYGLTWSAVTEAGGLVVADEVKIHANMEFTQAQ